MQCLFLDADNVLDFNVLGIKILRGRGGIDSFRKRLGLFARRL